MDLVESASHFINQGFYLPLLIWLILLAEHSIFLLRHLFSRSFLAFYASLD